MAVSVNFWCERSNSRIRKSDSSVLIRTVAMVEDAQGWRFEARAGAGLVADSDPKSERAETEAKISALSKALTGKPMAGNPG